MRIILQGQTLYEWKGFLAARRAQRKECVLEGRWSFVFDKSSRSSHETIVPRREQSVRERIVGPGGPKNKTKKKERENDLVTVEGLRV